MKIFKVILLTMLLTMWGYGLEVESKNEISQTDKILRVLYISYFDRAPDVGGLAYWSKAHDDYLADGLSYKDAFVKIANDFFKNSQAGELNSQSNEEFIKSVYLNQLGEVGDREGIKFWKDLLDGGLSRSEFMVDFVTQALSVKLEDITEENFPTFSDLELETAQKRVKFLDDKLKLSVSFTDIFGELTNLKDVKDIANDPSYIASQLLMSEFKEKHDVDELETLMKKIKEDFSGYGDLNGTEVMSALVAPLVLNRIDIPFREIGYEQFPSKVIASQDEMDRFINQIKNSTNWNDKEPFLNQIYGADVDFNSENILFYRMTEGSGSISLSAGEPILSQSKDEVLIDIKRDVPKIGTADMAYYALVYIVDKGIKRVTFDDKKQKVVIENKSSDMVVPLNCKAWFDGCNSCAKDSDGLEVCTQRYCLVYRPQDFRCTEWK